MKDQRRFDPGISPVYPLPQRDPMRILADWGAPPDPPVQPDPGMYERMGLPPWASQGEQDPAVQRGWRASRPGGIPAWALVSIVVGAVFLVCAGCAGLAMIPGAGPVAVPVSTSASPEPSTTSTLVRTTQEPEKPTPANRIGQPVRAGDFQYTVHKVKCGISKVGDKFLNARAQGSFCRVDLTVKNVTRSAHTFHADGLVKARDSTGREFSPSGEANIYGNKDGAGFLDEINPGNQVRSFVYFDVPKGAKLVRLELSAGLFTLAEDTAVELA
jgi:hypothetical protein